MLSCSLRDVQGRSEREGRAGLGWAQPRGVSVMDALASLC